MHLLSLDPATRTGWARYKSPENGNPAELASGVVEFDKELWAFNEQYRTWLAGQIVGLRITGVIIERPILPMGQTNIDALLKLYGLYMNTQGIVRRKFNLPLEEVQNGTWRSHFLIKKPEKADRAKGKLSRWYKKAVKERCQERGWTVRDDNEADALGILDYARSQLDPSYAANSTPLFEGVG